MGHGYVRSNYGCNCFYEDSPIKRYNRAHGDTTIFNFNYGYQGNGWCGRHIGFGGGLGIGIGAFLGNMFVGLFGGMGNMFGIGNMGFGNLFGIGGGSGWGNWGGSGSWGRGDVDGADRSGNGRRSGRADRAGSGDRTNRSNRSSRTERSESTERTSTIDKLNADYPNAITYTEEIRKLWDKKAAGTLKQDDIDALRAKIEKLGTADGIDNANDAKMKEALLKLLPTIGTAPVVENEEVTIGGSKKKIGDITPDDINKMTEAEIKGLAPEIAGKILKNLGYINADGVGQISNNYKVLLLLEKSGVDVEVEHRAASSDQWVAGPISDVKNTDGKLSYNVDCSKCSTATIKGKYTFTAVDNKNTKYKVSAADTTTSSKVNIANIEVIYKGEKKPLENESGNPLVTVK